MLTVKSTPLELRGIANKTSKTGKIYYVLNCETDDGTPHALYCPSADALPSGLKKGDIITVDFQVSSYKGSERLVATHVDKV